MAGSLSIPGGKEHPYLQRWRDPQGNPNEKALLSFLRFTTCISYSFLLLRFPTTIHSYQTWYKTLWFNHFFQVFISFWRLLCHLKLLWSTSVCFSLPNPSFVSLIYKSPAGESRREGEKDFFPPLHVHEQGWWCCLVFEDWKAGWSKVQR